MHVELLSYTPEARELLLFTKQTRLTQSPGLMDEVRHWPEARKQQELAYMLGTIQSSWEFVDYVFAISGVSRAFTHQLVRHRHGSYAQQSQRTVDMTGFSYIVPRALRVLPSDEEPISTVDPVSATEAVAGRSHACNGPEYHYHAAMEEIQSRYRYMIEDGIPPQDARGVLPTNVETNIIAKYNLRSLSDMAQLRLCTRTQGEAQEVFRAMRAEVLKVHPWAEPFIRVYCAATGVCCFPNYHECPIKPIVYNPDARRAYGGGVPQSRAVIQQTWEQLPLHEARPAMAEPTTKE